MDKIFKRNPLYTVLFSIAAIVFIGISYNEYISTNKVFGISSFVAIVLIFNILWSIATPFVKITSEKIYFKIGIINSRTFNLNEIASVEFPNEKNVVISRKNGSVYKINIQTLKKEDRTKLKEELLKRF
ncbi:hypothetical protein [Aureivirga marina]|uniref:hypothetical protein n=1 Tax=Aureivirga marina TaxID=1182451 RepID=UPI0018C97ED6|nr:hypothetical protein [Aureivirga marina]